MINEEGGIDPEQFRMEAMFDRMDAIGKGILGLTIQCAQCHNHKYDPLTQEEYYRMFAFLNNTHEANVAVYTPAEQKKTRRDRPQDPRDRRADPAPAPRLARADGRVGEAGRRRPARRGRSCGPRSTRIRPAARSTFRMEDGSFLAQGYAPTKHTREADGQDRRSRRSRRFASSCSTTRTCRLRGPGRSIKGTAALTEFQVEAAPADGNGQSRRGQDCPAPRPTSTRPRRRSTPIFDDQSKRKRVTGPVAFAIDGKDETAWGIDVGPGRRNQPRKAVFALAEADRVPGRRDPDVQPEAEPRRLEQRRQPEQQPGRFRLSVTDRGRTPRPTRCPPTSARSWRSRASKRTAGPDGRRLQLLADDGARVEGRQRPDRGALERSIPKGSSQLVLREREKPRATHILQRGDFLKPGKAVDAGRAGVPAPAARRREPATG